MPKLPPRPRDSHPRASLQPWRRRLHEVVFEADTSAGKAFDLVLLVAILLSVLAEMLESVGEIRDAYGSRLLAIEWLFTGLFTVEYLLRLISVERPSRYARHCKSCGARL